MAKNKIILFLSLFLLVASVIAFGHDSAKHKKKADTSRTVAGDSAHHAHSDSAMVVMSNTAPLKEFPTLHPLIVHIPIVFLLMSAVMQVVSLFLFKKELAWTAWSILLIGFLGAYASSTWFHAHTTELSPETQHILEEHEAYAAYTQWMAGVALLIQSINLFFLKRKMWLNSIVAILVIAAAVFVALAGHHGAELVHKHGIDAKGYRLEQHHH